MPLSVSSLLSRLQKYKDFRKRTYVAAEISFNLTFCKRVDNTLTNSYKACLFKELRKRLYRIKVVGHAACFAAAVHGQDGVTHIHATQGD